MSFNFNISEIYEIGIEIEKNGRDFYNTAVEETDDHEIKKVFSELANWENRHILIFKQFSSDLPEEYKEESAFSDLDNNKYLYLKAAADTHIFNKNLNIQSIVKGCKTPVDILKLALQFEKDSVVLFTTMKNFVPENLGKDKIAKLINEELMHISFIQEKINSLS